MIDVRVQPEIAGTSFPCYVLADDAPCTDCGNRPNPTGSATLTTTSPRFYAPCEDQIS